MTAPASPPQRTREATDEMVAQFEMAYLESIYPDRRDFAASLPGSRHFEGYRAGLRAVLAALAAAGALAEPDKPGVPLQAWEV